MKVYAVGSVSKNICDQLYLPGLTSTITVTLSFISTDIGKYDMSTAEAFCFAPPSTTSSSCQMDHLVCGEGRGSENAAFLIRTCVDKGRHALSAVQCRVRSEVGTG